MKPGAQRLLCESSLHDLEAASFVNPDGSVATVVMNRSERPLRFGLCIAGAHAVAELPRRSIATCIA